MKPLSHCSPYRAWAIGSPRGRAARTAVGPGGEAQSYVGATQDQPMPDGSATNIIYGIAGQDGQPRVQSYTSGGAANYVIRDRQGDPLGLTRGGATYMFVTDNAGEGASIGTFAGGIGGLWSAG